MSETELAQHFVDYYRDYEVFKEVPMSGGRCDIVVRAKPVLICIEVKTTLNIIVIDQALRHSGSCNYTYIGVPEKSINNHAVNLCGKLGIGILSYKDSGYHIGYITRRAMEKQEGACSVRVREYIKPQYKRAITPPRLIDQMKHSVAGAQHNSMSEFRVTVLEIISHLESLPGHRVSAKAFFEKNGRFHYSTSQSARQCICRLAAQGAIPELDYEKGVLMLSSSNKDIFS